MREADPELLNELMTWMDNAPADQDESVVRVRSWFCLTEYSPADHRALSELLVEHGASAGFAACGRDAADLADVWAELVDDGHELIFHGNRHTSFAGLDYQTAYGYIDAGLSAIEDAVGVRPTGFFVPFMDTSPGTLRAAAELGIEWLYARPEGDVPAELEIFLPVMPADSIRLQRGEAPATVMADFEAAAADGERFLFHPHYLEYFDAAGLFADWVEAVQPVSVAEQRRSGGVGLVLDAVQPLRLH